MFHHTEPCSATVPLLPMPVHTQLVTPKANWRVSELALGGEFVQIKMKGQKHHENCFPQKYRLKCLTDKVFFFSPLRAGAQYFVRGTNSRPDEYLSSLTSEDQIRALISWAYPIYKRATVTTAAPSCSGSPATMIALLADLDGYKKEIANISSLLCRPKCHEK